MIHKWLCRIIGLLMAGAAHMAGFAQPYVQQAAHLKHRADSLYVIGQLSGAQRLYEQQLSLYERHKDWPRVAEGKSNLSVLYFRNYQLAQAIRTAQEGLRLLPHQTETDTIRFRLHRFLGLYYRNGWQYAASDGQYEKAYQLIERSPLVGRTADIIGFYTDLGRIEQEKGNFEAADQLFQKAEASFHLDPLFNRSAVYSNLGLNAYYRQQFPAAARYYDKAITQTQDDYTRAYVILSKTNLLIGEKRYASAQFQLNRAWQTYQQYRRMHQAPPDMRFEQSYTYQSGVIAYGLGLATRARKALTRMIKQIPRGQVRSAELSDCYKVLAEVETSQGRLTQALHFYQQAVIAAHQTFNNPDPRSFPGLEQTLAERELFRALVGKADVYRLMFAQTRDKTALQTALTSYLLAIEQAEKMRRQYRSATAKLFFTETYFSVYEKGLQLISQIQNLDSNPVYTALAFTIYERSRAAILSDQVRETELKPQYIPADLLKTEQTLTQAITHLELALKQTDSATKPRIQQQLLNYRVQLERLSKRFEREYPVYYGLKYQTVSLSLRRLQQALRPDAALLTYFLGRDSLFIGTLTRQSVTFKAQPIVGLEFRQQVAALRTVLSQNPGVRNYKADTLASALYANLIAPIAALIQDKKRLLIIRDAELNYLPFEVLKPTKNEFLLHRYAISYGYSAGLLLTDSLHSSPESRLAMAPFAGSALPQATYRGHVLVPLPNSESEVNQIDGETYVRQEATRQRFLDRCQRHGIIHFATHAVADDQQPLRSFIAFYPNTPNYKLFAGELANLDLRSVRLVVLSGCETGAGRLQRGEGLLSLARAFTSAGVKTVAATLWNANDEVTAYLATHFHRHLDAGLPLDEALQRAKLDFLASELARRYDHPYYWANLILLGPSHSYPVNSFGWIWLVAGVLLSCSFLWLRLKK